MSERFASGSADAICSTSSSCRVMSTGAKTSSSWTAVSSASYSTSHSSSASEKDGTLRRGPLRSIASAQRSARSSSSSDVGIGLSYALGGDQALDVFGGFAHQEPHLRVRGLEVHGNAVLPQFLRSSGAH